MFRRTVAAVGLLALVALPGCGGSSGEEEVAGSSSPTPSSSPAALDPGVQATLAERLSLAPKLAGEMAGDTPTFQTGEAFAAADPDMADAKRLRDDGLQAAAIDHFKVVGTEDAIRAILVFDSEQHARQNAEQQSKKPPPGGTIVRFNAPGLPGAIATDGKGPDGGVGGRNVVFIVGSYQYVVGCAMTRGSTQGPTQAAMAAAATGWYNKVKSLG